MGVGLKSLGFKLCLLQSREPCASSTPSVHSLAVYLANLSMVQKQKKGKGSESVHWNLWWVNNLIGRFPFSLYLWENPWDYIMQTPPLFKFILTGNRILSLRCIWNLGVEVVRPRWHVSKTSRIGGGCLAASWGPDRKQLLLIHHLAAASAECSWPQGDKWCSKWAGEDAEEGKGWLSGLRHTAQLLCFYEAS